jgi:hypothetical protein
MSRHKAFDASRHKARFASRHKAFAPGISFLDFPFETDVVITYEAWKRTAFAVGTGSETATAQVATPILLHDRYFHNVLSLFMSTHGTARVQALSVRAYTGTVNLQTTEEGDLATVADLNTSSMQFTGWRDWGNPPVSELKADYIISPTKVEFHGEFSIQRPSVGTTNVPKLIAYAPFTTLSFPGPVRDRSLEWIMFDFPDIGLNAITGPSFGNEDDTWVVIQYRFTITV